VNEWHDHRPVLNRRLRQATTKPLPPLSATQQRRLSEYIEAIARAVAHLDNLPLTHQQQRDLRNIARELFRRATS
jgi:hypothetical protein